MARKARVHHKSCILYDWNPGLTTGLDEDRDCRCPSGSVERFPCGHDRVTLGCGGCDPGAGWHLNDAGQVVPDA